MTKADKTIRMRFDPFRKSEELRQIFADDIARTLYLLWAPKHLIGPGFEQQVLNVASRIKETAPTDSAELLECFSPQFRRALPCSNFSRKDCESFCESSLPYFTLDKTITFVLDLPVVPQRQTMDCYICRAKTETNGKRCLRCNTPVANARPPSRTQKEQKCPNCGSKQHHRSKKHGNEHVRVCHRCQQHFAVEKDGVVGYGRPDRIASRLEGEGRKK